jgi:hypothetical protein
LELVAKLWPLIFAAVTVGVWLVRLEAKLQENSKDVAGIGSKVRDGFEKMSEQIVTLREKFAELKGHVHSTHSRRNDNDKKSNSQD